MTIIRPGPDKTVREQLEDASSFAHRAIKYEKLRKEAMQMTIDLILSGKNSGDKFKDYVIVLTGEDSKELTDILHHTESMVSTDELVLLICTWKEEGSKVTMKNLFLGVLNGDKLIVDPPKKICDFPIGQFTERSDGLHVYVTQRTAGSSCIQDMLRRKSNSISTDESSCKWEFQIGNSAIRKWVRDNKAWESEVLSMSDELGRSLIL